VTPFEKASGRRLQAIRGRTRTVVVVGGALLVAACALLAGSRVAVLFESTAPVIIAVEPGQNVVSVPARATGVNVAVWDGHLRDAGVPELLRQAGIGLVRYPGGATADVYHWRTNAITPGQDGYVHPANTFATVMAQVATPAGARALVTVNYGSNETGTGGGDPAEAAAWVYYANRLHQQAVRFWEIGNEVYGNGYYGRRWETDLHGDHSPATYARNALAYIKAMKAVDPTIKVGLDLVVPGDWPDGLGPQHWNETVLAIAGRAADFVSLHWYAQQTGLTSDSGLLRATEGVPAMMTQLRALLSRYVGAHAAAMTVLLTETNSASSPAGKQTTSVVNGLFLLQDYLAWLQAGAALVAWWDLHNGPQTGVGAARGGDRLFGDLGLLSSGTGGEPAANTPFPAYTALTLLRPALSLGAVLTRCSASVAAVTAFAMQQSATRLSLVLVNTSPTQKYTVMPSVAGVGSITAATASGFGAARPRLTTQRLPVTEGKVSYVMQPYSAVVLALTIPPGQMPPLPTPGTATAEPAAGARPIPMTTTTPVTSVTPQLTPPVGGASPRPTVIVTQVATATRTATATPTGTETATATPSATSTGTATATPSATSTGTATATPSATSTGTATATPSGTPTGTATVTPSGTPTSTVTVAPTGTATATPSGTPTGTATMASTATATSSGGPTATPTATVLTTSTITPGAAVTMSSVPTGGRP